jgi:nitrate reductase assembly molybdenum cofactor insertion protein NarJ
LGQEHQLPDYLPVLLRLLSKLDDKELRGSLIVDCMIPALERMLRTLSGSDNPYQHLIMAATLLLNSEARAYPATVHRARLPILHNAAMGTETKPILF